MVPVAKRTVFVNRVPCIIEQTDDRDQPVQSSEPSVRTESSVLAVATLVVALVVAFLLVAPLSFGRL